MASTKSPLSFFSKLILENGRDKLWDKFVPGEQERANSGLSSFDPNTGVKQMIDYDPIDHSATEYSISFVDHILKPRLENECRKIRKKLSEKLGNLSIAEQEGAIIQLSRDLKEIYDKVDKFIIPVIEAELIKRYLKFIQNHISSKYKAPDLIRSSELKGKTASSIIIKELKSQKVKSLLIEALMSIHDIVKNGICDSNPSNLLKTIESIGKDTKPLEFHFTCKTKEAAYILNRLSSYYKELSWELISNSRLFYSYKGNLLTSVNLSKSYNDFVNKSPIEIKEQIDKAFDSVKKQ